MLFRTIRPPIGLILGSGLGHVVDNMEIEHSAPFDAINGLCASSAPSHAGRLIRGNWASHPLLISQGRVHLYEGYSALDVAMPAYLMAALGVRTLIITNAAGALNPDFEPGEICMITDHINFTGHNPLIGIDEPEIGVRFPDLSDAYDRNLRARIHQTAKKNNITLQNGIYAGVSGPSLETSAERRYLRQSGADLVGMSTIMEVIAANHAGLAVAGLSTITNKATGGDDQAPDSLEEVLHYAAKGAKTLERLLPVILGELSGT